MHVVEVLLITSGILFAILLTVLVFVLWKYLEKQRQHYDDTESFKNMQQLDGVVTNSPPTPPFALRMTSPQFRTQEYDPSKLVQPNTQLRRNKRKKKKELGVATTNLEEETEALSKSLNELEMKSKPHPTGSSCQVRQQLLNNNSPETFKSPSIRNENQSRISLQMKQDLCSLRKGKSPCKKGVKGSWTLNESGQFLPYLSSLDFSDSEHSTDFDSDVASDSSQSRMRLGARRGSSLKPCTDLKVNGNLLVTSEYFEQEKTLFIVVHRATNLGGEHTEESDMSSYVKLYLLPDKKQKHATKVVRGAKDPVFEERFAFTNLPLADLGLYKLTIKVFNSVLMKKDEFIGETAIFLSSLKYDEKEVFNLDLLIKKSMVSSSSLQISLCHQGTYSKLEVIVHNAKNLIKKSGSGNIDPYVRVSLYKDDSIETRETHQISNERNPEFNESFDFNVMTAHRVPLSTYSLAVTVMHHSLLRKSYALGHVIFTVQSPQYSAEQHLLEAECDPHRRITKWHNLIDPDDI